MLHLVGTAGHVDHGKTSLIRALTGIDTDRLPEEKRRGLTIELGFAFLDIPDVGRVSIVDVPGHHRFLHHMLSGAMGVDVALLCIAADQGIMPQTREHLQILELLPTQKLVIAVTRADLADADLRDLVHAEIEEFIGSSRFGTCPLVFTSATTLEGLDELKSETAVAIRQAAPSAQRPWYVASDRHMVHAGFGTVLAGTLMGGPISVGDPVEIQPEGLISKIKGLQIHSQSTQRAEPGQRVAINLTGVKSDEVHRGSLLGQPGSVFASTILDVRVRWIKPGKHGARVRISIGAEEVIGRCFLSDADAELVQLRTEVGVGVTKGMPVVIRAYSPPSLLAGGVIVVPVSQVRRKNAASRQTTEAVEIADLVAREPWGMPTDDIARLAGRTPTSLAGELERLKASAELLGFAGLWFTPLSFTQAVEKLEKALARVHTEYPTRATLPRDAVLKHAGIPWSGKPLDRIISHMAQSGSLRVAGTQIALASHRPTLAPRQRELLNAVLGKMTAAGLACPDAASIALELRIPSQAVKEIIKIGIEAGELTVIGDGLVYPTSLLEDLAARLRTAFAGKTFTPADFRDGFGATRKYAIPLLEYFDARGVTKRFADGRVVN